MIDGWGRPYQSEFDGTTVRVTSLGRDNKPGVTAWIPT